MSKKLSVLILEDRLSDLELLLFALKRAGYEIDYVQVDTEKAYIENLLHTPDIILADYTLPQYNAMQALHHLNQTGQDIPFIVVTGTISEEVAVECMKQGAADYLLKDRLVRLGSAIERALEQKALREEKRKADEALRASEEKFSKAFYISPDAITITRMDNRKFLEINQGFQEMTGYSPEEVLGKTAHEIKTWAYPEEELRFDQILGKQGEVINFEASFYMKSGELRVGLMSSRIITFNGTTSLLTIVRDITDRKQAETDLRLAYDATIEGWSRALELRDSETQGHANRVTQMAEKLARMAGIAENKLLDVRRGVLLHDIGKMAIPDEILLKPGPLSEEEWEIMRQHPEYAYRMLKDIDYLNGALDIPCGHHERWDGTGYPLGLKGEEIPLAARVFAIVDVWDALRSKRPYRNAEPAAKVISYIHAQAGKHFDPDLVEKFLQMLVEEGHVI